MKTINDLATGIQEIIAMFSVFIHGCKQGAHMFDDAMNIAREQQLAEAAKLLESK
ncbi:MAG: hypothetical protein HOC63_02710 [Rhodospirillales bacterium]|jgi:hypothetical protein|nr:hypothetical protein [Rhodospirillales bacterium]